jgi:hypothetical protein
MPDVSQSLDPLADYLESEFGDAYDNWTPELRSAVQHYILHELDDMAYAALMEALGEAPESTRQAQAEFITSHYLPFDVVDASHRAALHAIPGLQQLIDILLQSGIDNGYEEVNDWLHLHATYEERVALYRHFAPNVVAPPQDGDWWFFEFGYWLYEHARSLKKVAQGWQMVTNPTASRSSLGARAIRSWAKEHGHHVGHRGRIPDAIIQEYLDEEQKLIDQKKSAM